MSELDFRNSENSCSKCGSLLTLNPESGDFECAECASTQNSTQYYQNPQDMLNEQMQNIQAQMQQQLENDPEYQRVERLRSFYTNLEANVSGVHLTKLLILINAAVFFGLFLFDINPFAPSVMELRKVGANYGPLTTNGEWWRLLSCTFLHGGVTHLAFNLYALWAIGQMVEKLYGHSAYFTIYFISGLAGSLASIFNVSQITSVGASGAVFGIFGALIGYFFRHKDTVPREIFDSVLKNAIFIIVINGAIGFSIKQIDNAAHIGGALGGLAAGYILSQDLSKFDKGKNTMLCAVCWILAAAGVFFSLKKIGNVEGFENVVNEFTSTDAKLMNLYKKKSLGINNNDAGAKELLNFVKANIIPEWEESSKKFWDRIAANKKFIENYTKVEYVDLLKKYATLRGQYWTAIVNSLEDPENKEKVEALKAVGNKIADVVKKVQEFN